MLKVKDWLNGQKDIQFTPTEYYDTPSGSEALGVVRIIDNIEFRLITHSIINLDYHYDNGSDKTIKLMLGIAKFNSDNIHVTLVCLAEILNSNIKSHYTKVGIQINEIEKSYSEVISSAKEEALRKIKSNFTN